MKEKFTHSIKLNLFNLIIFNALQRHANLKNNPTNDYKTATIVNFWNS